MSTWTGQSRPRMLWVTTSWCATQRLQPVPHHLLAEFLSCGQSSLHILSRLCEQTPPRNCKFWASVLVHSLWADGSL